ncbi:hypothetical protein OG21DRAFT_1501955 [Imleria badia]|nr:hypothetical protein OG21DRAFT_1501955 [Imleria badia]
MPTDSDVRSDAKAATSTLETARGDLPYSISIHGGKIIIKSPSRITNSTPTSLLLPTFQEPDIQIDIAALDSSTHDQLADAEPSLTDTITNTGHQTYHALANRALVRARLQQSDQAIDDAQNSIKIRPSVNGYIAKSVALISRGKKAEGCRVYDLAFRHCNPTDVDLILLIKMTLTRAWCPSRSLHIGTRCRRI